MEHAVVRFLSSACASFERGFRHPTGTWCARHRHPVFEIVYHIKGSGITTDEAGAMATFREGGVVIHPPGIAHDQAMPGPGEDACVSTCFRRLAGTTPGRYRAAHTSALTASR